MANTNIADIDFRQQLLTGDLDSFKKLADTFSDDKLSNMVCPFGNGQVPVLHYLAGYSYSDNSQIIDVNKKIEYLHSRNCDINKPDKDGHTALMFAVQSRNLEAAIALLQQGAKPFDEYPVFGAGRIYDMLFDKDGNYYDFPYKQHDIHRKEPGSEEDIESIRLMSQRLEKIRNLCKPEYKGKPITVSCEKLDIDAKVAKIKDKVKNKINESRKMTNDIKQGMDKSTPIKHVDANAPFNVVATKTSKTSER